MIQIGRSDRERDDHYRSRARRRIPLSPPSRLGLQLTGLHESRPLLHRLGAPNGRAYLGAAPMSGLATTNHLARGQGNSGTLDRR